MSFGLLPKWFRGPETKSQQGKTPVSAKRIVRVIAAFFAAIVPSLHASQLSVSPPPSPAWPGRETSATLSLTDYTAGAGSGWRICRIVLSFQATPSNNFEVAFFRQQDGPSHPDVTFGWDAGQLFLRPSGMKERYAFTPSVLPSPGHAFTAEIRVSANGQPAIATFATNDEKFAFDGLTLNPMPSWLQAASWTHLQAVARGAGLENASISAEYRPDTLVIVIR